VAGDTGSAHGYERPVSYPGLGFQPELRVMAETAAQPPPLRRKTMFRLYQARVSTTLFLHPRILQQSSYQSLQRRSPNPINTTSKDMLPVKVKKSQAERCNSCGGRCRFSPAPFTSTTLSVPQADYTTFIIFTRT
jgi:hypothetical protein